MNNRSPDSRSSEAKAYHWAARIMTLALEMVVPGLVGYWIDQRLGSTPLLTLIGFVLGMGLGTWHLVKITSAPENGDSDSRS